MTAWIGRMRPCPWAPGFGRIFGLTMISALAALFGVIALFVYGMTHEQDSAERAARLQAENLARLMAEQVALTVGSADLVVLDAMEHLRSADLRLGADLRSSRAMEISRMLTAKMKRAPHANALTVSGANGENLYSSRSRVGNEDRFAGDEFERLRDAPSAGLAISSPYFSQDSGMWEINLSRRIDNGHGSFAGIISIHLNLNYFEQFYTSFDLGPHGVVLLRDRELRLLARFPPMPEDLGKAHPDHHALPFLNQGMTQHSYHAASVVDEVPRLYSFRQAGNLPLIAFAGLAEEDYLGELHRHFLRSGLGVLLMSAVIVALGFLQARAQKRLKDSGEGLQRLLDSMAEGAYGVDQRGNCTFVNQAFLDLLGWTDSRELVGKPIHELIHDATAGGTPHTAEECPILSVYRDGLPYISDKEVLWRRDGFSVPVEVRARPIVKDGKLIGAIATFSDVSELRHTLRALQENEVKFRNLFEAAGDAIFLMDRETFIDCNRQALEMFGCERHQIVGTTPIRFSPEYQPDGSLSRDSALARIDAAFAGRVQKFEWQHCQLNGIPFDAEVSLNRFETGGKEYLQAIVRDISERKLAERQLRLAATAFEAQQGIVITDADTRILQVNPAFTQITGYSFEEALGLTPRILKSGKHDQAFYQTMWAAIKRDGAWQGEIWNRRKNGEIYPEWLTVTEVKETNGKVSHYVAMHIDISMRKQAEEEVKRMAFYDPLTRLPNRRLLMDRLKRTLASGARKYQYAALFFIDLDNFKTLNDTQGHDRGDQLLQQVAKRLATCLREGDTVGRLGGDEFLIIMDNLGANRTEAAAKTQLIGDKILASLNQPYVIAGRDHHSTLSIGISLFAEHVEGPDSLLKQADLAMYRAKETRNRLCFFDPSMQAEVETRIRLEAELQQALRANQFTLHFQAQADGQGRTIGAEALLRWQDPQGRLTGSEQFMAVAEQTGQIVPLGDLFLELSCRQLQHWSASAQAERLPLTVEVATSQFRQEGFVDQIRQLLDDSGINPQRLRLAFSEDFLLTDFDEGIGSLITLKDMGLCLALNGFGTGKIPLASLKRLPVDQLRIDPRFIQNLLTDRGDAAIAYTILDLGLGLGMSVLATGVETEAQRDTLARHGCRAFQGGLFTQPCSAEDFEAYLDLEARL
jgi:diguanylate cyclase (GGDEF)-like protein/PAS domain S-box-containing protein